MPTSKASPSTVVVSDSVSGVRINTSATSPEPSTSQGYMQWPKCIRDNEVVSVFQTQAQKDSTNCFKYVLYPSSSPKSRGLTCLSVSLIRMPKQFQPDQRNPI